MIESHVRSKKLVVEIMEENTDQQSKELTQLGEIIKKKKDKKKKRHDNLIKSLEKKRQFEIVENDPESAKKLKFDNVFDAQKAQKGNNTKVCNTSRTFSSRIKISTSIYSTRSNFNFRDVTSLLVWHFLEAFLTTLNLLN